MEPRKLVELVFEGAEPPRVPLHVESDDKRFEAAVSDLVGAGAKISEWRSFYTLGGPFHRREGESLGEWLDRVRASEYAWPGLSEVVEKAVSSFRERISQVAKKGKFLVFKVLGPTETAESFFTRPQESHAVRLGHIAHRFDFGVFYALRRREALRIYERIASYVLELIKAGAELEEVDAIRVADDAATYTGPIYPPPFYEEAYLPWHRRFASAIKHAGKYALLHCDGDIRRGGLFEELSSLYDGLHPLDISPKSTLNEAMRWVREIAELRREGGKVVFFTGIPVDLVFNDSIPVTQFLRIPLTLLKLHGKRHLVLATTHSEYPSRSYGEGLPRLKISAVRRAIEKL
ncbi:MAG: hypothetical protein DRJ57_05960 [Thermoprotei archaeon]|nr:MAG: hypothetical protein DRJ57_05960 [Thermoprotei archaeon]